MLPALVHAPSMENKKLIDSDKGPSELAINGFIASMMVEDEEESQDVVIDLAVEQHNRLAARYLGLRREDEDEEESE